MNTNIKWSAELAAVICKSVAELPDRNSPEGWPDAMLVTHDELATIVTAALAAPAQPVAHVSQETFNDDGTSDIIIPALPIGMPLYAAPQPPTSAEPTQPAAWKMDKDTFQFLSDVMTAAGLVEHGKQCKALAKRLNSGVMAVRETFQARWAPDPDQKIVKVDCGDYYQWQAAPAQAQPVAELVTTAHGFETTLSLLPGHFDLPYGTHLLYAAPQPAALAQAATAKQSPHPEYDKGFSDGWNRCEARQAAAPAQAGEYQPSSADMVMAALDTGEWDLERMQHWHCITDEGNRVGAWLVKRQKAPYCACYTDKPGAPYGPRSWSGPTALDALQKAADDLGIRLPQPAARGAAQAAPVDAAVQQDAERLDFMIESCTQVATISPSGRKYLCYPDGRMQAGSYPTARAAIDAATQKDTND